MRHNSPLVTILPAMPVGISEVDDHSASERRMPRAFLLALALALFATALIVGFGWLIR